MPLFADVILPLPLPKYFTYRIPEAWRESLVAGSRVVVPFGRTRFYTAIVVHTHNLAPKDYETKEISTLLDAQPVLRRPQLQFWEWIADYYLCAVGDVFKAAIPSGQKIESETQVAPNPEYVADDGTLLKERESLLLDTLLQKGKMNVQELERESGLRNTLPVIRTLLERGAILISEEMQYRYKPRTEVYVRVRIAREEREKLRETFEALKSAKKQIRLLMTYLDMSGFMRRDAMREVSRRELLECAEVSPQILAALTEKGIFECYRKEVSRFAQETLRTEPLHRLTPVQQEAYDRIVENFARKSVTLLHGVTSCGKTEIYMHLIDAVVRQGRQVLYLVPEIALTTQLAARLQRVFGRHLAVYHSKFTDGERVEIWNNLLHDSEIQIVLGVRSAVFLPFRDLGLVIVDEEHETSYKQQEPAPRYHARNAAIVLASMHGAKTLLGTATPSVESYYNAQSGKYGLVGLAVRYEEIELPRILVVDTGDLRRKRRLARDSNLSPQLVEISRDAQQKGEQVIFFQNRRGYAPMAECRLCAWTPRCERCDVSLTYHKYAGALVCHYCGYTQPLPHVCPSCGEASIEIRGFGTERVEEEVERAFPDTAITRMDLDTTRSRKAYEQMIADFEQQKSRILIGTQMVTKGLDFDHVSVVGILNADMLLNYPDFRAHERAFQMMEQVAGRAGRRNRQGTVLLQTACPQHPVIAQVVRHDYAAMYAAQIAEREQFAYPPFSRLIYIYFKHRDETVVQAAADAYVREAAPVFGSRLSSPHTPPVARIQNSYIRRVMLKVETAASVRKVREALHLAHEHLAADPRFRTLTLYYDVDPM